MKALVIAERADAARELCAGARTMADEVVLVSFGEAPEAVADKVARVSVPEGTVLDDAAATVISVFDAEAPAVVLAEPTRHMKAIAGRLAAHAGTSAITDAMSFEDGGARSLYFGGVAERVQKAAGDVAVYTVGAGAFEGAEASGANAVEDVAWVAPAVPVRLVSSVPVEKSGVDLNKADVVVAAGRGFAEESELDLARELCDKLGAGLACSRPLTEGVNWLPTELYVGVSGLMLSPKAYVACGISGQMQHMVGCNRAGTMFAINKDKNAPVFKQCDYGLVGDLKDVLPKLVAAL
jgi:electron transfer flavoprotein alpha subunit